MKISKILAGMSAAALAASMMAMAASAASDFTNKDGAWEFADAKTVMADADGKIVINYTGVEGWNDISFGFSVDESWKQVSLPTEKGTHDYEIKISDITANLVEKVNNKEVPTTIKDISTMSYGKIEGFNKCTINSVTYVPSSKDTSSSTADSSTVAGDSSKADVTSSAAAGDSSKADDTSKPADGTKVDPMTLKAYLGTGSVPLIDEKDEKDESIIKAKGVLNDTGVAYTDVYGFTVNVTFGKDANAIIEKAGWLGGGMGINAKSCGWSQKEWSLQEGNKDVTGVKAEDGSYNFTLTLDKAAFVDTDKYAQVWFQNWTTKGDTINAVTLLGKDGKALATVTNDPSLAPKDDKKDDEKKDDTKKDDEKKDDNKGSSSVADGSSTTSTTSTTSTNSTGTTSSKAANNASNTNPSTGAAALAAVGVALAGAAVVATKKRK